MDPLSHQHVFRQVGWLEFNVPFAAQIWLYQRRGKEEYLYRVFLAKVVHSKRVQAWITQFYMQITTCPPFLRERSPDVTTTATEAADIQLQLTTHLSTPKG